jgi:hypothetical protein
MALKHRRPFDQQDREEGKEQKDPEGAAHRMQQRVPARSGA